MARHENKRRANLSSASRVVAGLKTWPLQRRENFQLASGNALRRAPRQPKA